MTGPQVSLDFTVHWCSRHLEPYRARWPLGAGVAMVRLFEAWVSDERVAEIAPKGAGGKAKTAALDALAAECSPLCCFISDEALEAIYAATVPESPA